MNITEIYFSPSGTTKQIVNFISKKFTAEINSFDLLKKDFEKEFDEKEIVVVGMPVFAGRIPSVCIPMLEKLKGNKTLAIPVVVYGNRDYEDSLLELCDLLEKNNFIIVGAAAFIARHSIFPSVAKLRPDNKDFEIINQFAKICREKIENNDIKKIKVNGNKEYVSGKSVPIVPTADSSCTKCMACVKICPAKAISEENPKDTDKEKCISCTACIYNCPMKSRKFKTIAYKIGKFLFEIKCSERKEPEIFIN